MKYFVYSYNYLTLFKAVSYARNVWGVENTYIIYTSFVSVSPKNFVESDFNKLIIKDKKEPKKTGKFAFFNYVKTLNIEKKIVDSFTDYIKEHSDTTEKTSLVIFRDNYIRETILIKQIHYK